MEKLAPKGANPSSKANEKTWKKKYHLIYDGSEMERTVKVERHVAQFTTQFGPTGHLLFIYLLFFLKCKNVINF